MTEIVQDTRRSRLMRLLSEPLGVPEFAAVCAAAVLGAVLYCQLYCFIAFPLYHHVPMALSASLPWSIAAVLPWVACLEFAKRRFAWGGSRNVRRFAVASLFVIAAAASVVLEFGLDRLLGIDTRPLPRQVAAQLSAVAITAGLLLVGAHRGWKLAAGSAATPTSISDVLALSSNIQWIEAAGNYVEVHCRGGTSLHRVTMRELERRLDPAVFRRVHRSAIVNLRAVAGRVLRDGSPAVRLADGTVLKVGGRYATNLS